MSGQVTKSSSSSEVCDDLDGAAGARTPRLGPPRERVVLDLRFKALSHYYFSPSFPTFPGMTWLHAARLIWFEDSISRGLGGGGLCHTSVTDSPPYQWSDQRFDVCRAARNKLIHKSSRGAVDIYIRRRRFETLVKSFKKLPALLFEHGWFMFTSLIFTSEF